LFILKFLYKIYTQKKTTPNKIRIKRTQNRDTGDSFNKTRHWLQI